MKLSLSVLLFVLVALLTSVNAQVGETEPLMQFLLHVTVTDPSNPEFQGGIKAERAKVAELLQNGTWQAFYAPEDGSLGFYAMHSANSAEEVRRELQVLPLSDFLEVTVTPLQTNPLGLSE